MDKSAPFLKKTSCDYCRSHRATQFSDVTHTHTHTTFCPLSSSFSCTPASLPSVFFVLIGQTLDLNKPFKAYSGISCRRWAHSVCPHPGVFTACRGGTKPLIVDICFTVYKICAKQDHLLSLTPAGQTKENEGFLLSLSLFHTHRFTPT